jgi:hypothetical protein
MAILKDLKAENEALKAQLAASNAQVAAAMAAKEESTGRYLSPKVGEFKGKPMFIIPWSLSTDKWNKLDIKLSLNKLTVLSRYSVQAAKFIETKGKSVS